MEDIIYDKICKSILEKNKTFQNQVSSMSWKGTTDIMNILKKRG